MTAKPVLLHFKFDNFTSLSTEVDSNVCTEVQTDCNGNKWRLKLYPGGERRNTKEGHVGLYLRSCNDDSIDLKYNISIINYEGICANEKGICPTFSFRCNETGRGWPLFKKLWYHRPSKQPAQRRCSAHQCNYSSETKETRHASTTKPSFFKNAQRTQVK